jgi:hypothetical protein
VNSAQKQIPIPSREIPSADAAGEEHVTTEERAGCVVRLLVKTEASGTVPWNFENIHRETEKPLISSFAQPRGSCDGLDFEIQAKSSQEMAISKHHFCGGMHGHGAAMEARDGRRIPDMIKVTVGEDQQGNRGMTKCLSRPFGSVDQKISLRSAQKEGIGLEATSDEHF